MKRPWMPLYVADFIADTTQLGATETGIYIRLIMHCWQHGSIPRDDRKLALISHCDVRLWRQYRETTLQFFDVVDASTMQHKRVSKEIRRSEEISNKRKNAALQKHSKCTAIAPANGSAIVYTLHTSQFTEKEESCPVGKPTRTKLEYSEQFEKKFWMPYPRSPNMSKPEAWKAWQKLPPDKQAKSCQAVGPYKLYLASKRDLEAVHACRFLSQERFEGFAPGAEVFETPSYVDGRL